MHGGERADHGREIEAGQPQRGLDGVAVGQEVERLDGAPVGGAEGDEGPCVPPAAEDLEEVAGDEAPHGVGDEDEPGVGVARVVAPAVEEVEGDALQASGVDAVVPAPVVGELEVVVSGGDVERSADGAGDAAVAVDGPDVGEGVEVGHERRGAHAVVEVVLVRRVLRQGEVADGVTEGERGAQASAGGEAPDLPAVVLEHAAEDAGEDDDDVVHLEAGHGGSWGGRGGGWSRRTAEGARPSPPTSRQSQPSRGIAPLH